ncbi:MAG: phage major capsid protein [Chloroflexota bacterium]|nr:phage major capsid protein [Chloroflexota bacterium]
MALTLAEAAKLSNDIVLQGVIETVIQDSPVLQALPFIEITGNGLTYNRENAAATAAFFQVGDTWTESTPTFSQITASLTIVGGDADIDNYLLTTRSNVQDLQSAVIRLKAKAVQQKFEDTFVNGDTAVDVKSFDGIDKLTTGGQAASMGVNGATLTLAKLDELIDLVKGGGPDLLLMSKRTRRSLNNLARTAGSFLQTDRNDFGQMVQFYDGIPIGASDYISDAKTVGTSADCSTVYAMQFGEGALAGLTAPGGLQVETIGSLETKDATRTRVKWYVSTALFNTLKVAKLTGVRP